MLTCTYTKQLETAYHALWETSCGRTIASMSPIEVGWAKASLPNADGAFCRYCGKQIELVKPYSPPHLNTRSE